MALAIAMLVSYIPFFAWSFGEIKRQNIEANKTH